MAEFYCFHCKGKKEVGIHQEIMKPSKQPGKNHVHRMLQGSCPDCGKSVYRSLGTVRHLEKDQLTRTE